MFFRLILLGSFFTCSVTLMSMSMELPIQDSSRTLRSLGRSLSDSNLQKLKQQGEAAERARIKENLPEESKKQIQKHDQKKAAPSKVMKFMNDYKWPLLIGGFVISAPFAVYAFKGGSDHVSMTQQLLEYEEAG